MYFNLQLFGGRGSGSNKTKTFRGYENGNNGEYANPGYLAVLKLPIGAEFTVHSAGEDQRTHRNTQRYRVDELNNDGRKHLFTVEHWGKRTYIAEAAVTSLISEKGNVKLNNNKYVSPIKNIQRLIGKDAVKISIHNGGKPLNYKNRKAIDEDELLNKNL